MRRYSFDIGYWNDDELFSPIRNKKECIIVLMKSLKIMIANQKIDGIKKIGEIVLVVSKMSRIFYISEQKTYSINFPFTVTENDGELFYSYDDVSEIDSMITSQIISVIKSNESFDSNCIYEFTDHITSIADYSVNFWPLLRKLILFEDGYIRYDNDIKNDNGLKHPRYHYDIFYSSNITFKIGLRQSITHESLIDLLLLESNCHFLEKPKNLLTSWFT